MSGLTRRNTGRFPPHQYSEGIRKEDISWSTNDFTKVAPEDEGGTVSIEDIVCQEDAVFKGSAKRRNPYSISLTSKKVKSFFACRTALLTQKKKSEVLCCIFPGSLLEYKKQIDNIFTEVVKTNLDSIINLEVKIKL